MIKSNRKINANPTKGFFIHTLVKDIDLIDAILDLIDNSIDSYIINEFTDRKKISIFLSESMFKLEDFCGGIKKEKIYDHVFRFGKPSDDRAKTIGVFGIGLKRALFKMGKKILIESDDGSDFYSILIDEKWLDDEDNWELNFEKEEETKGIPMTRITISDLYPNIASELKSTSFENELRKRIKDTYSTFIENQITIELNEIPVEYFNFKFLADEDHFYPCHTKNIVDDVEVEIFAGYTPGGRQNCPFGWYVFCNDRLIIRKDTTIRTGWGGEGGSNYHYPEDNRFLGLVFFRSDNPMSLPWKTTKEDIQYDSRVYRNVQVEMKSITKRLVDVIRLANKTKDPENGETIGKAFFEGIPIKNINRITKEQQETVPAIKGEMIYDDLKVYISPSTNIQYTVKKELLKKVKQVIGNPYMSNKNVGEMTYQYYIDMEDIDDE